MQGEMLANVKLAECRSLVGDVPYLVYSLRSKDRWYVAEGLAGYDAVLRVGLRSLVRDRELDESISIPATAASASADLARARAEATDPLAAIAEGYSLNNDGRYAEAAEYFSVILRGGENPRSVQNELLAAHALQQSNMGSYAEADATFAQLEKHGAGTTVTEQFVRNAHAIHLLNAGRLDEALIRLRRTDDPPVLEPTSSTNIDQVLADQLNSGSIFLRLTAGGTAPLPESQRSMILAAQRHLIEATILRLSGDQVGAQTQVALAHSGLDRLSPEQLSAATRLQSQIITEEALQAGGRGHATLAEQLYRQALKMLSATHPETPAYFLAQARLAGHLAANGQAAVASALFREIVRAPALQQAAVPALKEVLRPYFRLLLTAREGADSAAEIFFASQLAVGPGVAQTQAVLARELGAGDGEVTRLFRRSVTAAREAEQTAGELARLEASKEERASARITELIAKLRLAKAEQVSTLSRLSGYSQFRAIASQPLELRQLQAALRSGEAYWKLSAIGQDVYGIFVTSDLARAYLLPIGFDQLNSQVSRLRESISVVENGETIMYPFDAELSYRLFNVLAGPVAPVILNTSHLIFEPDGEMSRVPLSVLVTEQPVHAEDRFDFTQTQWLGRRLSTTTSVSARGFTEIRGARSSKAIHQYIGFGENAPSLSIRPGGDNVRAVTRCSWPASAWSKPISAAELRVAQSVIGAENAKILTGEEFTDSHIKQLPDLSQYRILHFATHGLTDPPREGCSAEPALLTSVGKDSSSDGLLSFREIFDLELDADLVILSACNTASGTSRTATAAAGLRSGGEFPLDGLVRAFVGAGSRSVMATQWPVPDDYDATERLLSAMFRQPRGTSTADAVRHSQLSLMSDAATSHPFYWAAFVVIGDGSRPLLPQQ